jgi:hypothetical protein
MYGNPALKTRGKGRFFINFRQPAYTRRCRTLTLSAMSMFICNVKGQEKKNGVHSGIENSLEIYIYWDRTEFKVS